MEAGDQSVGVHQMKYIVGLFAVYLALVAYGSLLGYGVPLLTSFTLMVVSGVGFYHIGAGLLRSAGARL